MSDKHLLNDSIDFNPRIYAYRDNNPEYIGILKIGYTTQEVAERIKQQYPTLRPGKAPYEILLDESAIKNDGSTFTDREVHAILKKNGFINLAGEWFRCTVQDVKSVIRHLQSGGRVNFGRFLNFKMRPEQIQAVNKTVRYFENFNRDQPKKIPHFLWNAKMRFGKTFTSYQLALRMGWKKVLVLTFKPAVESAWEEDLKTHTDFKDWQFVSKSNANSKSVNTYKPFVCFGSFQDFLGKNSAGGIKSKNEWVHEINWNCVVFDEYHYGAWRETAKELFEQESSDEISFNMGKGINYFDKEILPITSNHYLYLSGTPFRALESGEFIEEQIFNWTYTDEQSAKRNWDKKEENPYASLPKMVLMTYQLPDSIREIAMDGEYDEFDLNTFFAAKGDGENAFFINKSEVQKWLDLIRGAYLETSKDNLKLGGKKPPLPFYDLRLLQYLHHTFWFLPSVSSCYAMRNLIQERQNIFYQDYKVIVAAGKKAGIGLKALDPVKKSMDEPLKSKTITLSCGKLTTGVTIKPWSGIFMLRNLSSPETYFQAAFRVQSPWVIDNPDSKSPNKKIIIKQNCYIFDFAPERALRQISDYSCRLSVEDKNPEEKVEEFTKFLPVLAYDGSSMKELDAGGILDIAMSGTSATLLARRWESALLVNVDDKTLQNLMNNKKAMEALMNIEGFRTLNQDLETIINRSESIKKTKEKANENELNEKERKKLTDEEKEYRSLRKKIQDKLIKFATRIPVFMYLTDFRERRLKDVITKLEPGLFKKVTGINIKDFELLVSLNVFNSSLMNDAVYKFKRYEDSSLSYSGVFKHEGKDIGLFDTVIKGSEIISKNK
tara:strand:- start:252 stop:2753 length:2502 start_codon:yes stop_codon:yes gene_type:complete